ncbi:hypothetical protein [Pleurocapsa sp. PCC 7319]|uniref:hypothetical protein n=1 Tax=Pleurocapsa sp. PCC 7319 TaxID=118161 RepID=UPI00035DA648|nr:hypothetical protein [Pleurocapsa sp. PCC 7319]
MRKPLRAIWRSFAISLINSIGKSWRKATAYFTPGSASKANCFRIFRSVYRIIGDRQPDFFSLFLCFEERKSL